MNRTDLGTPFTHHNIRMQNIVWTEYKKQHYLGDMNEATTAPQIEDQTDLIKFRNVSQ